MYSKQIWHALKGYISGLVSLAGLLDALPMSQGGEVGGKSSGDLCGCYRGDGSRRHRLNRCHCEVRPNQRGHSNTRSHSRHGPGRCFRHSCRHSGGHHRRGNNCCCSWRCYPALHPGWCIQRRCSPSFYTRCCHHWRHGLNYGRGWSHNVRRNHWRGHDGCCGNPNVLNFHTIYLILDDPLVSLADFHFLSAKESWPNEAATTATSATYAHKKGKCSQAKEQPSPPW
mmetsp:Transcript_25507/g.59402  ORF Transcript_25507/g.59402 Transcript_25507/m.59402 type:complete len:227 (+) Transcript_25507:135-815(+)